MLLYLIRHGEPDYENDALTETGEKQARALAVRFSSNPLTAVYASAMGRAMKTALCMCENSPLTPLPLPWISEIGAEGFTCFPDGKRRFVITLPPSTFRTNGNQNFGYDEAFNADGLRDTGLRTYRDALIEQSDAFLSICGYVRQEDHYISEAYNAKRIAVVAHNGSIRLWLSYLLHIPLHIMFSSFTMAHTGVTVLHFEPEGRAIVPVCLCFSDMSHLLREGLPFQHRRIEL